MPSRGKIYDLPADILTEFHQEIEACRFSDYKYLSDWLKTRGYDISKSAVHNYATKRQAECLADANGFDKMEIIKIRAACITAAASVSDRDSIIKTAETLLRWVMNG
ncbi:MAG: phage protein Gp27 family protein [Burkholderia gladioli]